MVQPGAVDGLPGFDVFAGDLRVANVAVELSWNGQLIDSKVSDANGAFSFHSLGITTYNVCVIPPSGFRLWSFFFTWDKPRPWHAQR